VYALRDPLACGGIFYVGKGVRDRAYHHARHAKRVEGSETSAQLKLDRIREIHDAGRVVGVEIIRHELRDEWEAFEVEAAVIDALEIAGVDLTNVVAGRGTSRGWRPLDEPRSSGLPYTTLGPNLSVRARLRTRETVRKRS